MPEHVNSTDEIVLNALTFDQGESGDAREKKWHKDRIKNNSHFVALKYLGVYIFAPWWFAVYKDNDSEKRFGFGASENSKQERILNKIIGSSVKHEDINHDEIEAEYLATCSRMGTAPNNKGRQRIYWIINQYDSVEHEIEEDERNIEGDPDLSPAEKIELRKARRGRGKFRTGVQLRWQKACAVTANLDALFDRYLISFRGTGEMIVSEKIPMEERVRIGIDVPRSLRLPLSKKQKEFLKLHRCTAQKKGTLKECSDSGISAFCG